MLCRCSLVSLPRLTHLVRMLVYVSPEAVDVFYLEMVQAREPVSLDLLMLQQDAFSHVKHPVALL